MWRTRIKFCGITRVEDALLAAELGADAIGLVLHADSARRVSRDLARQIIAVLPAFVTPVGLFVDAEPELIIQLAAELRLRHLQLHGNETPATVAALRGYNVLKAIRVSPARLTQDLSRWRAHAPDGAGVAPKALILETAGVPEVGGTGIENDWDLIRAHQDAGDFHGLPPIVAAGGLRPDNVAAVVRMLRPWAVDVSSGIESTRGIKSPAKMAAFVEAVRSADVS